MSILTALIFTFLIFFPIFFLDPAVVYLYNRFEFSSSILAILRNSYTWFSLFALVFALLIFILPAKVSNLIRLCLIYLVVAWYLQGFIFVWDYGLLNGEEIDWSHFQIRYYIDLALWLGVLVLIFFNRRFFLKHSLNLGFFLFSCHLLAAALALFQNNLSLADLNLPKEKSVNQNTFALYEGHNTLIILLDEFYGPAINHIYNTHPEDLLEFKDFIYFKDTLAAFPSTAPSIPAILTGQQYRNQSTLSSFLEQSLTLKSLPVIFEKSAYDVSFASLPQLCQHLPIKNCTSPAEIVTDNPARAAYLQYLRLFDTVLFRFLPQSLKKLVYNEDQWLLQNIGRQHGLSNHQKDSLELVKLLSENFNLSSQSPTFKFFHLMLPHSPYRLDADCNIRVYSKKARRRLGENWKKIAYLAQARCALKQSSKIISKLKQLNVYDRTTIVLIGDHGSEINYGDISQRSDLKKIGRAFPLLMLKKAGSKADSLQISTIPASVTDLAKTILELNKIQNADISGLDLFSNSFDLNRQRIFLKYTWQHDYWSKDYLPNMQEFIITGDSWQLDNWRRGQSYTFHN